MKAAQVANKKHMLWKCKKQKCMHAQHFSAQLKLQRTIGKRKAAERHTAELQRIARPLWLPPSLQGEWTTRPFRLWWIARPSWMRPSAWIEAMACEQMNSRHGPASMEGMCIYSVVKHGIIQARCFSGMIWQHYELLYSETMWLLLNHHITVFQ